MRLLSMLLPLPCALLSTLLTPLLASSPAHGARALPSRPAASRSALVKVRDGRLELSGHPFRFVGANLWYGMNLSSSGPGGDRARLSRELDRLQASGITVLRVLGASEGPDSEPWRVAPSLQPAFGVWNEDLLRGLDFLLAEMGKRGMRALVCLGNYWPWSGGMAQYLNWAGAGPIPYPPPAAGGSWDAFQRYTARFYSSEPAMAGMDGLIRKIVARVNSVNGLPYSRDPVILAWELANEPRGIDNARAFNAWLARASGLVKSLDPDHLVTTGSEGETPDPASAGMDFVANHRPATIDFATAHVWAQNWGWFDPLRPEATYAAAAAQMREYLTDHVAKARRLGKPLVVEEFGLARDGGSFDPVSSTLVRDRYFGDVFEAAYAAARDGGPLSGIAFWAWAGEGRPRAPSGGNWFRGDDLIGDPPHEPQGWYGIYDTDTATRELIARYAAAFARIDR